MWTFGGLILLYLWCVYMLDKMTKEENLAVHKAKRRQIYAQLKNNELVKKGKGEKFNQSLINACNAMLQSNEKPKLKLSSLQELKKLNFNK